MVPREILRDIFSPSKRNTGGARCAPSGGDCVNNFDTYHRRSMKPSQRFLSFISLILDKTSCWEWQGKIDRRTGYGAFWSTERQRDVFAHRASVMLFKSIELPYNNRKSGTVCHTCDNRKCVRPSHLHVASQQWNAQDRNAKGRANTPLGENNGHAKLSNADIPRIYSLKEQGRTQKSIAQEYGVCRQAIGNIFLGRSWKSVQIL